MADVQVHKGHIRIANQLYRAAMLAKLSPYESRALMECLWRQYGWANAGCAPVPFRLGGTALAQAIGGSRTTASQALTTLVDAGVIYPTGEPDDRGRRMFLVRKDFDRWTCGFHRDPKRVHWTPKSGDVSPYQNASVLTSVRERPDISTQAPPESQPAKAFPRPLEPRENQEENQTPIVPKGTGGVVPLFKVPEEPKRESPVQRVWDGYVEGRQSQRKVPGADAKKRIRSALKEYSVEELIAVSHWILLAPDDYCRRQREGGYTTYSTIYKPTGMQDRVDKAMAWAAAGKSTFTATEAADHDGWWAENGARWLRDAREFSMVWRQTKGEFGVELRTVEDVVRFVHAGGTKQAEREPDVVKPPPPVDWLRPKVTPLALEIPWVEA
jgi:DNA-binding transcriptional ArsR family regulator